MIVRREVRGRVLRGKNAKNMKESKDRIPILRNEHPNELVALELAERTYNVLLARGEPADFYTLPREGEQAAIVLSMAKKGLRLRTSSEEIYDLNMDAATRIAIDNGRLPDGTFSFHNYATNSQELKYFRRKRLPRIPNGIDFGSWKVVRLLNWNDLSPFGKIDFCNFTTGYICIDTPAFYKPNIDDDVERAADAIGLSPDHWTYLHEADVERSRESGLLDDDVPELIADSIVEIKNTGWFNLIG